MWKVEKYGMHRRLNFLCTHKKNGTAKVDTFCQLPSFQLHFSLASYLLTYYAKFYYNSNKKKHRIKYIILTISTQPCLIAMLS